MRKIYGRAALLRLAREQAERAGGHQVQVGVEQEDRYAQGGAGWLDALFVESAVVATAADRRWPAA